MKKTYTKKQIIEAIAYWKKQLKLGNCKKLDEASSADEELLKKAGHEALDDIEKNIKKHVKHDYGIDRVLPGSVAGAFFDYIKAEPYGFSSKFKEHANGIGNNSEWSIIKNGKTVGSFWCTDDMFGSVFAGVNVGGEEIDLRKFKYVYVPPEEYVPDGDALTWKELHQIFEDAARNNPDVLPGEWYVDAVRLDGEGLICNDPVNDVEVWSSDGRLRLTIAHVESLADKGKGWLSLSDLAKATEKYAQEDPDGAAKLGFGYMRYRGHLSRVFDYNGKHVWKVCYLKYAEFDPDDAVFSFGVLPVKKVSEKVSESTLELSKKSGSTEKKQYTKKQITEAIAYWKKQLKKLDEAVSMSTTLKILQLLLKGGEWNLVVTHSDGRVTERIATCSVPPELRAKFKDCLSDIERLWYYVPAKGKICCVSRYNVRKLQLLPVGRSAILTVTVTDDMAEAWFKQLKTCRLFIEITGKNGKKNTVEASLEGISLQECDRLHDDIANGKLWFKPVQSWKFNHDLMYVNFRADDIASITLHPIPYRVLVGDKTSRIPKIVKKTKDLQTAIDELTRLAELDMAPAKARGLSGEKLNINGIDSRYNGYGCDIWLDLTAEAPSLLY